MEILVWPFVTLIIVIAFMVIFKPAITSLISRTKKLGKEGLEIFDSQSPQQYEEKRGIQEFFRVFENPLLLETEQLILKDLKDHNIDTPTDREKTLLRLLASKDIVLHFERLHRSIWASQLALLRFVNTQPEGVESTALLLFYEDGKNKYPDWYENYPFDRWIRFLESFNLILMRDSRVIITVAGREFLKFLVETGKSGPYHG